jgi:NAD(P)-dependent dehydrogenase (short-subunit alcohol dehydrogenase family)
VQQLRGRVAVVTGAASGIGFGLAERFSAEGMRVVLADVEAGALSIAEQRLRSTGAEVVAVRCDVSRADEVQRLADTTLDAFGAVHVVCNNAGVADSSGASVWEASLTDWEWVVGVNFWGVVHGVRSFVPLLLRQAEGHVVNTASMAGLIPAVLGSYSVTKHAVVALSEALRMELAAIGAPVGVSVLCPGVVATRIFEAERNRPDGVRSEEAGQAVPNPLARRMYADMRRRLPTATQPSEIAACVVDAIRDGRLYVLPHPAMIESVRQRTEDIERGRPREESALAGRPRS